jgi:hypothetical protein
MGGNHMLLFIVARSCLARYEALRSQLRDSHNVKVLLDRREGERRTPRRTLLEQTDVGWNDVVREMRRRT